MKINQSFLEKSDAIIIQIQTIKNFQLAKNDFLLKNQTYFEIQGVR